MRSPREMKALTIQPRRCRRDTVIARILSEHPQIELVVKLLILRVFDLRRGDCELIATFPRVYPCQKSTPSHPSLSPARTFRMTGHES
jgi:hypothetical protein